MLIFLYLTFSYSIWDLRSATTLSNWYCSQGYAFVVAVQLSPYSALEGLFSKSFWARAKARIQFSCESSGAAQRSSTDLKCRNLNYTQRQANGRPNPLFYLESASIADLLPLPVTQGPCRTSLAQVGFLALTMTAKHTASTVKNTIFCIFPPRKYKVPTTKVIVRIASMNALYVGGILQHRPGFQVRSEEKLKRAHEYDFLARSVWE